uniref:hypothetical protein n=1 Tax=Acetatifactor sp. TaxID=1872090 RepID=UPI00405732F7
MQKAYKAISAVAGRILFIGFGIQIVLGLCWMIGNFPGVQLFSDTLLYEEISKTFICDEYEGILYPVLIMLTKGIEELAHIPYRFILYLIQIGFAFFASYKMLECVGIKDKILRNIGAFALLTFPMAMQCHLAVLPESLVSSWLILELGLAMRMFINNQKLLSKELMKILICWTALSLLAPENLLIGAVPVVFVFLYDFAKAGKEDRKKMLGNGILAVAFLGMILFISDLSGQEGDYGRPSVNLGTVLAGRTVWSNATDDYGNWPEEVKTYIPANQIGQVDYYADNVEKLLVKTLEDAVGEERAKELLLEIVKVAWQHHKRDILHQTAWDVVGYAFSPLVVQRQFTGKAYESYSGRNFDIMRERTPILASYYMEYGCWWFGTGLVISAVVLVIFGVKAMIKKAVVKKTKGKVLSILTCLCTGGVLVGIYSLRGAGMMDYKKSIAVVLLWMISMLLVQNKMLNEECRENG